MILNLDYGSFLTKAIWKFYDPCREVREVPAYGLSGLCDQGHLLSDSSHQLNSGASLKEAFLLKGISLKELRTYRQRIREDLGRAVFPGVRERMAGCGFKDYELLVNIHSPVQFVDSLRATSSGIFHLTDADQRLMQPAYRDFEAVLGDLDHGARERSLLWVAFLADAMQPFLTELAPRRIQVATIPESLTIVNRLVDPFEPGERRQFLMLDIGHFTTDYALIPFDKLAKECLVVRCANSIYESGFRFISEHGVERWIGKLLLDLNTHQSESRRPLSRMDLSVVLTGGGSVALDGPGRQRLVDAVTGWACQDPSFRQRIKEGDRSVFIEAPCLPASGLSVLRPGTGAPEIWSPETVPTHVPCIAACMHAHDFREIKVPHPSYMAHLRLKSDPIDIGGPAEGAGIYPNRELDGWVVPETVIRCAECSRVFTTTRAYRDHRATDHMYHGPRVRMAGAGVAPKSRIAIHDWSQLSQITFYNWTHGCLTADGVERGFENNGQDSAASLQRGLPEFGQARIRLWSQRETGLVPEMQFTLDLEVVGSEEMGRIEDLFLGICASRRRVAIDTLDREIQNHRARPGAGILNALHGFLLAMKLRDQFDGSGPEWKFILDKLTCSINVLSRQRTPVAETVAGLARFLTFQLADIPGMQDPVLRGLLHRLQSPGGSWSPVGMERSPTFAKLFPMLDCHAGRLVDAYGMPPGQICTLSPDLRESPIPDDREKWNLLLASAFLMEGRLSEGRNYLTRLSIHHPVYGGWVQQCLQLEEVHDGQ